MRKMVWASSWSTLMRVIYKLTTTLIRINSLRAQSNSISKTKWYIVKTSKMTPGTCSKGPNQLKMKGTQVMVKVEKV